MRDSQNTKGVNHSRIVLLMLVVACTTPHDALPNGDVEKFATPVEFSVANIKRGRQYFTIHCISCHGVDGRGDTEMREFLKTPPADLSDGVQIYGANDTAIFSVVKEGLTERDMPAFADKLTDEKIWQVMSYMEYLGGRRP